MTTSQTNTAPDIRVFADAATAERFVAEHIAAQMRTKPDSVLGLATGNSMIGVYRQLIELYRGGGVSFAGLTSFNLDEYFGLPADDRAERRPPPGGAARPSVDDGADDEGSEDPSDQVAGARARRAPAAASDHLTLRLLRRGRPLSFPRVAHFR